MRLSNRPQCCPVHAGKGPGPSSPWNTDCCLKCHVCNSHQFKSSAEETVYRQQRKYDDDGDGYLTEEKKERRLFSVSFFFWGRDDRVLDKEPLCRALGCSLHFLTTVFRVVHFLLYFKLNVHLLPLKPLHLTHLLSSPPPSYSHSSCLISRSQASSSSQTLCLIDRYTASPHLLHWALGRLSHMSLQIGGGPGMQKVNRNSRLFLWLSEWTVGKIQNLVTLSRSSLRFLPKVLFSMSCHWLSICYFVIGSVYIVLQYYEMRWVSCLCIFCPRMQTTLLFFRNNSILFQLFLSMRGCIT